MRRVPQHDGVGPAVSVGRLRRRLGAVALLVTVTCAHAAGRAIEDVRFVKQNGVARAEIVFACPVRYLSHTPDSGTDVQVRIVLDPECVTELGSGVRSELFDPPAGNLAGVKQVVFDTTVEDRVARVAINVGRVVRFAVSQGAMRNVLRVELDQTDAAEQQTERVPDLAPSAPPPALAQPRSARAKPGLTSEPAPAPAPAGAPSTVVPPPRPSAGLCGSCSQPRSRRTLRDPARGGSRTRPARRSARADRGGARDLYVNERRAGDRSVAGAAPGLLRHRSGCARAARFAARRFRTRYRGRERRRAGRGRRAASVRCRARGRGRPERAQRRARCPSCRPSAGKRSPPRRTTRCSRKATSAAIQSTRACRRSGLRGSTRARKSASGSRASATGRSRRRGSSTRPI